MGFSEDTERERERFQTMPLAGGTVVSVLIEVNFI